MIDSMMETPPSICETQSTNARSMPGTKVQGQVSLCIFGKALGKGEAANLGTLSREGWVGQAVQVSSRILGDCQVTGAP